MEHVGTDVSKQQDKTGSREPFSRDACVTRSDWYSQRSQQKNQLCNSAPKYATLFLGNR
jgi:hypothetical protein